mmetsp:Transcript_11002/g.15859  ORF Transcript_11002/g.15859 Transcript_11002/m.15859 type:complete len:262 (-) Transcript_11002:165-950(-)
MGNDDQYYQAAAQQQQQWCVVYDTQDGFTTFVQGLLCALALGSLWIKRQREVPRRKFFTWFLDVSKQSFGAVYAHILNMLIAGVIVSHIRGNAQLLDQCAWYATMYVMDTVLGLLICIYFLNLLDRLANEYDWTHLKNSGVYTGSRSESLETWGWQLTAWFIILTIEKAILFFLMWAFSAPLAVIAGIAFKPLQGNIKFELLFVMILFPGVLNIIWFWITDHFLKADSSQNGAHEKDPEDSKQTSLLEVADISSPDKIVAV